MSLPLPSNHSEVPSQHILELITHEHLHLRDLLHKKAPSSLINHIQTLSPRHEVNQEPWQLTSQRSLIFRLSFKCFKAKMRLKPPQ
jgi:hypothetical protein